MKTSLDWEQEILQTFHNLLYKQYSNLEIKYTFLDSCASWMGKKWINPETMMSSRFGFFYIINLMMSRNPGTSHPIVNIFILLFWLMRLSFLSLLCQNGDQIKCFCAFRLQQMTTVNDHSLGFFSFKQNKNKMSLCFQKHSATSKYIFLIIHCFS